MANESGIEQLETYIERILTGYNDLRAEVSRLEMALQDSQSEVDRLSKERAELAGERQEVLERVNSLIAKIAGWETDGRLPTGAQAAMFEAQGQPEPRPAVDQPRQDAADDQQSATDPDDNSGGQQGNLFADHLR